MQVCHLLGIRFFRFCNLLLDSGAALDGAAFEIAMSVYLLLHLMFATVISTLYPVSFDEHAIILFVFLKFRAIFQVRITERNVEKKEIIGSFSGQFTANTHQSMAFVELDLKSFEGKVIPASVRP